MTDTKCARKVIDYIPSFETVFDKIEFGTSEYEIRQKRTARKEFGKAYGDVVSHILLAFSGSDEMPDTLLYQVSHPVTCREKIHGSCYPRFILWSVSTLYLCKAIEINY